MFSTLSQDIQDELSQLAQRFGQPVVHTADLTVGGLFDPLNAKDRYGEVCMVVRRPNGHLLLMKKIFYPRGGYRLLTGGINFGEAVHDALLRETYEETGLEVSIQRFLAAVAYRIPTLSEKTLFYTFAFLLDEVGGVLNPIDEHEQIEGFREILPSELSTIADTLEHTSSSFSDEFDGNWHDWGVFRAVIHRQVWQAFQRNA